MTNSSPLSPSSNRWVALWILCLGVLMIVLDTTIVNVALPSIKKDLAFDETTLAWVINAYMLTFGGSLLLGGKLGDIYGKKRVFMMGMLVFTLASLGCGLAQTQLQLIIARAIQGLGGAAADAVAFAMIISLFSDNAERAKAIGFFSFVASGGGALGVVLGGIITSQWSWEWNFLVNVPLGIVVLILAFLQLPRSEKLPTTPLDVTGALIITSATVILVYAILNGNAWGWWTSEKFVLLIIMSFALLVWFYKFEFSLDSALIPFSLFRKSNLSIAAIIGAFWSASMFSWFFLMALFLEQVHAYPAIKIGLAFLPANLIMALFSLVFSAKLVLRWGNRRTLFLGMLIVAVSLALCAFSTTLQDLEQNDHFWVAVFPSMALLGIGCGMALNPIMMAAMDGIQEQLAGIASGVVNTAFMLGGSLGLAILASSASLITQHAMQEGETLTQALTQGYKMAFVISAATAFLAAWLAKRYIRAYT